MRTYESTYKKSYNFNSWLDYWSNQNFKFRHSSWKPSYPSFITIQKNSESLTKEFGNYYINRDSEYMAKDEKGFYSFFDKSYHKKGEWRALPKKNMTDLFV
jgi:hypothetical protein